MMYNNIIKLSSNIIPMIIKLFIPVAMLFILTACSSNSIDDENVLNMENITSIVASNGTSFVLDQDNMLWGWGSNRSHEIHARRFGDARLPIYAPMPILSDVVTISANGARFPSRVTGYVLAISSDSTLWGWGEIPLPEVYRGFMYNFSGFVSPLARPLEPVIIADNIKYVSAGIDHFAAVTTEGNVFTLTSSFKDLWDTPEDIGIDINLTNPDYVLENVIKVSAGNRNTFAIKNDNTLWAWGENAHGQIGNGTTDFVPEPVKIMEDVIKVSAGVDFTMAIKSDFTLWAWGNNDYGQLGIYGQPSTPTPTEVKENIVYVSAGMRYTMAIDINGTLWAWGLNTLGQLGDGTNEDRLTPVAILDNVETVSVGGFRGNEYTLALKNDGTLWAWGANTFSQLGDGTTVYQNKPLLIDHMD